MTARSFLDPPRVSKMEAVGRVARISLQQLPADILECLCSLLTGFDALSLSQTNSWWSNFLSDDSFWQKRLQGPISVVHIQDPWKKRYMQSRSMLFKALKVNGESEKLDAFVYLTYRGEQRRRDLHRSSHFQLTHLRSESFSFDLWFSLLPATRKTSVGSSTACRVPAANVINGLTTTSSL